MVGSELVSPVFSDAQQNLGRALLFQMVFCLRGQLVLETWFALWCSVFFFLSPRKVATLIDIKCQCPEALAGPTDPFSPAWPPKCSRDNADLGAGHWGFFSDMLPDPGDGPPGCGKSSGRRKGK